jgi:signal transduction histidine kinase
MGMRWLLALGLLLLNRALSLTPDRSEASVDRLVLGYLLLTLVEALFLWREWGMRAWSQVTLALDITLIIVLLFMTGGASSPLLPLLFIPVSAVSLRLGFSAGLGLNLTAVVGVALLTMWDHYRSQGGVDILQVGLFEGAIVAVAVFGGLMAERLGEQSKDRKKFFEERLERLKAQCAAVSNRARAFYEMSSTLSVTMSYQKVLDGILRQCSRVLDFSVGVVFLSAGSEELSIAASSGIRVTDPLNDIHLSGEGALSDCLTTAEPAILEYLGRDKELQQVLALQRCRSGLCVPLRAGLRNYGVIVLGSIHEEAYSKSDLQQLTALAHFATTAIQNAQLYQDLREERDKIISAEENVRKELSRDLHDGPAQSLAAIAMNAEFIRRLLEEDPAHATKELLSLEQLARKTAWDVRTMLFELRPIILETQGLVPTLEQYVKRFPEGEIPQVHLDTGGFDRRIDPKSETTIFTIMQEAVNNARKHAKAQNIWMRLTQRGNRLIASVQDDGVGFDLQKVESSYDQRTSFGLMNMQERAELIGGQTEIRSEPGKGTAVVIDVPLRRE